MAADTTATILVALSPFFFLKYFLQNTHNILKFQALHEKSFPIKPKLKKKEHKKKKNNVKQYQPFHTVCMTQVVSLSSLLIIKQYYYWCYEINYFPSGKKVNIGSTVLSSITIS